MVPLWMFLPVLPTAFPSILISGRFDIHFHFFNITFLTETLQFCDAPIPRNLNQYGPASKLFQKSVSIVYGTVNLPEAVSNLLSIFHY